MTSPHACWSSFPPTTRGQPPGYAGRSPVKAPGVDILIVDDGSRDGTSRIARELGVPVVRHPVNLGVGGALQTGFRFAVEHGYDIGVQLDADGQHDRRT